MPIFERLSKDELLDKCQHGMTQNANESLNQLIWKRCPKNVFLERTALTVGVTSAVLQFNDGQKSLVTVLEKLGVKPGAVMQSYCISEDKSRVQKMNIKCATPAKRRRKKLRAIKKGLIDRDTEVEGNVYESGAF